MFVQSIRTDWMNYPAGSYTFCMRFVRPLRVIEPQTDAFVLDEKNQLTKEFKYVLRRCIRNYLNPPG